MKTGAPARISDDVTNDLGSRVAFWLRAAYVINVAKQSAREFGVSVGTARLWLSGHAPTTEHILKMACRWGCPFTAFVFHNISEPTVDDRIAILEEEFAALRRDQEANRRGHVGVTPEAGRAQCGGGTVLA